MKGYSLLESRSPLIKNKLKMKLKFPLSNPNSVDSNNLI